MKKVITICSSAAHYKQVIEIEAQLKKLGFTVKIPKSAGVMKRTGDFNVDHYKTWYKDAADYKKKTALMKGHFKKVAEGDMVLITNFSKNGLDGYIGGNVLLEMFLAWYLKKPIYIYNPISDKLGIAEEVYGLTPIFINGDLSMIS